VNRAWRAVVVFTSLERVADRPAAAWGDRGWSQDDL